MDDSYIERLKKAKELTPSLLTKNTDLVQLKSTVHNTKIKSQELGHEIHELEIALVEGRISTNILLTKKKERETLSQWIKINEPKLHEIKTLRTKIKENAREIRFLECVIEKDRIMRLASEDMKSKRIKVLPFRTQFRSACYTQKSDPLILGKEILTIFEYRCDPTIAQQILNHLKKKTFLHISMYHRTIFSLLFSSNISMTLLCQILHIAPLHLKAIAMKIPSFTNFTDFNDFREIYQARVNILLSELESIQ